MTATVLLISTTSQLYGAPESLLLLVERMDRARFRPVVFCPYEGPLVDRLRALDVPVHLGATGTAMPRGRVARALLLGPGYVRRLRRTLNDARPEFVYVNTIGAATPALVTSLARLPMVVHVRESTSYLAGLTNRVRRLPLVRGADRLIAVSDAIRRELVRARAPEAKIAVVHNGVDPERCSFRTDARARIRAELGVPAGAVLVGLVGAIEPRKGALDFVDAARQLASRQPNARFVLVGGVKSEEYDRQIADRIAASNLGDRFLRTGFRTDVLDVYSALDVVANPTYEEPFARVNIEAMACERPVVATDVDGNPEAIDDGVTGRIVPVGDATALADGLEALIADPRLRAKFGTAARRRVLERFTADRYVRGVEEILAETIAPPRGRAQTRRDRPPAAGASAIPWPPDGLDGDRTEPCRSPRPSATPTSSPATPR